MTAWKSYKTQRLPWYFSWVFHHLINKRKGRVIIITSELAKEYLPCQTGWESVILSAFSMILEWTNGNYTKKAQKNKPTEAVWCIFETHRNKSYSPNSWILLMSSKTQLNTLIALDQFWNLHMNNSWGIFFYGPDQRALNSRETSPVNSVSFWWGPQVNLLCQYSPITQYHILQEYQIFQKAVFNWVQKHDNWITHVGLSGCPPPWTISTLYSELYWGQWNFCAF